MRQEQDNFRHGKHVGVAALVIGLILSLYLFVQEKSALKRAVAAEQSEKQLHDQAEQSAAWSQEVARAGLLLMNEQYDKSEMMLRDVPPHAAMVPFYNVFGGRHARRGQWPQALTNWNLSSSNTLLTITSAICMSRRCSCKLDDVAGYKKFPRTNAFNISATRPTRTLPNGWSRPSLIIPATADEMATISKMADIAVKVVKPMPKPGASICSPKVLPNIARAILPRRRKF